jgi:hypothetical protein
MTIDYFVRSYVLSLAQYTPPKVPSLAWNVDDVVESLMVWSTTRVCSCGATHMWWHYYIAIVDPFVKKPFGWEML